jgi:hypothetical protein
MPNSSDIKSFVISCCESLSHRQQLNNERIRRAIDAITSKVVLILGRFSPTRKPVLDAIRNEIRALNYLPILFDFDKPSSLTTVETVSTLAHLARFVIADLTDAKSVLQELQAIVPSSPSVIVQPLLLTSQEEPGMFDFIRSFPWVLSTYRYESVETLLSELKQAVIAPAEARAQIAQRGLLQQSVDQSDPGTEQNTKQRENW